jgi:DNA-binding response OmpR family regulator
VPAILVVDDDERIRASIARILRYQGHHVLQADSGSSALTLLHQAEPDLLILNYCMPGLDGLAVLRRLRVQAVTIPVLFTTAHESPSLAEAAADLGVYACLLKPFAVSTLLQLVRRALEDPLPLRDRKPLVG